MAPMTPEAPKRSLDAPSEAAHREPDVRVVPRDIGALREAVGSTEYAELLLGLIAGIAGLDPVNESVRILRDRANELAAYPLWEEREAAHREPGLDAAMRFAEARLADPFAGRDNLTVPRSLLVTLVEHIAGAAHPSGAGSGLRCSKCGSTDIYTHYDSGVGRGTDKMEHRCRNCRYGWWADPLDALATTPTVSRDGEIAAIAAALHRAMPGVYDQDCYHGLTVSTCGIDAEMLYDAGLRVAPSAPGDSLDVETLREAIRRKVDVTTTRRILPYLDVLAAEYTRLRSEPTGATE